MSTFQQDKIFISLRCAKFINNNVLQFMSLIEQDVVYNTRRLVVLLCCLAGPLGFTKVC